MFFFGTLGGRFIFFIYFPYFRGGGQRKYGNFHTFFFLNPSLSNFSEITFRQCNDAMVDRFDLKILLFVCKNCKNNNLTMTPKNPTWFVKLTFTLDLLRFWSGKWNSEPVEMLRGQVLAGRGVWTQFTWLWIIIDYVSSVANQSIMAGGYHITMSRVAGM